MKKGGTGYNKNGKNQRFIYSYRDITYVSAGAKDGNKTFKGMK
jgi:hypothetical protein